jgi:DNA-binding HxlR family transcriptional regulator
MEKRRSPCPLSCALELVGDKWTLLIVRDMLLGKTLFKEFASSPERIATNILSNRLQRLVQAGIAEKISDGYHLTEAGKSLGPIVQSLVQWGLEHIPDTAALLGSKNR